MIWYIFHNVINALFPSISVQHRNLSTFLIGVLCYTLIYSYLGTLDKNINNLFLFTFLNYFFYVLLSDAFAMAILYKNFFKTSIINEFREAVGANDLREETIQDIKMQQDLDKAESVD